MNSIANHIRNGIEGPLFLNHRNLLGPLSEKVNDDVKRYMYDNLWFKIENDVWDEVNSKIKDRTAIILWKMSC